MSILKKKLIVKIPNDVDTEKFIESIMSSVQATEATYRIKGNVLEIRMSGDPVSIERSLQNVRKILLDVSIESSEHRKRGKTLIYKSMVAKILGVPVPLEAYKLLLSLEGIPFNENKTEDVITVEIEIDEAKKLALDLFESYKAAKELFKGKAAEIVSVVSVYTGASLEEIIDVGKNLGLIVESDKKYMITKDKEKVLRELIDIFLTEFERS